MRSLSVWARHHIAYARIIIIISRCLLIYIAYFLGTQVAQSGINLSPLWIYFFIILFFITCATYPLGKAAKTYKKRKLFDFIISASGFFMMLCWVCGLNQSTAVYETAHAAVLPGDTSLYKSSQAKNLIESFQKGEKTKFTAKEKRIIKKEFNHQLLQYAKSKVTGNTSTADQVALIILACIAAVGLFYLVAALACTISCNGSDAAAIVVLVLGTAAIIWGLVVIIRSILRKKRLKTQKIK